jgi:ethanolamine utilization protein EutA
VSTSDRWHQAPERLRKPGLEGDQMVLISSGIDIGSSTMHLAVSRLVVERDGGSFEIVDRGIVYESPIVLTPYRDDEQIDTVEVERAFRSFYAEAELDPSQVDTGVVILTGVALERANARALGDLVASWGGQFLSVAAGDRLEGVLAAHGSGAVERSRHGGDVTNVDIGGGTIKVAWCRNGRVLDVRAYDIGTRLLAWEPDTRRIIRLEPTGAALGELVGLELRVGDSFTETQEMTLTTAIARAVADLLAGAPDGIMDRTARDLSTDMHAPSDEVVFSGGFTEYLAEREDREFGDLGQRLAEAMTDVFVDWTGVSASPVGIRATAIGAGQFTVQISGITIHRSATFELPLSNVPVVRVPGLAADLDADDLARQVRSRLELLEIGAGPAAIAVPWSGSATRERLRACARGLVDGVTDVGTSVMPLTVVCDGDVARLLGRHLELLLDDERPLLVLDGVEVQDLDFLDLARPVGPYGAIPVTVKSLTFRRAGAGGASMLNVG